MSSDDIANLYRQFGGSADNYKELGRDNVVRQSRERWPLLATLRAEDAARLIEPVRAGEEHPHEGPLPIVFDEAAAAQAAAEARARAAASLPPPPVATRTATETVATRAAEPEAEFVAQAPVLTTPPPTPIPAPAPAHAPAFAAQASPAPTGTELQGLFTRLARQPEPPAPAADPEVSLLRRLLKP